MPTKEEATSKLVLEALGYTSAVFMSQGDTMAKHIVMPEKELIKIGDELTEKLIKMWG